MLRKSRIGYTNENVTEYYAWNPGGFGCSKKCEGCWARAMAVRSKCEKCRNFEVHLHPERIAQPMNTQRPGFVLVNFTCDTFDPARGGDFGGMLAMAEFAPQHTYIWLTQQAVVAAKFAAALADHDNFYVGCTIRDQEDADECAPPFFRIPGNLWISYEPARASVDWPPVLLDPVLIEHTERVTPEIAMDAGMPEIEGANIPAGEEWDFRPRIKGLIAGHDNRRGAEGTDTLDHIRSCVEQCKAADVPVYVKQLWIDGTLRRNIEDFPEDLRIRQLPWEPQ